MSPGFAKDRMGTGTGFPTAHRSRQPKQEPSIETSNMKPNDTRHTNPVKNSGQPLLTNGQPTKVIIAYTAIDAEEVFIAGDFNRWDPRSTPLRKDAQGVWRTTLQLAPGPHEYRLIVDGEWLNDPRAARSTANPFGSTNSVLQVS